MPGSLSKKSAAACAALLAVFSSALAAAPAAPDYFAGVDLSYVNEMEDCGAQYRVHGTLRDPYELFAAAGANLVRLRLWNAPDWTKYSSPPVSPCRKRTWPSP